MTGRNKKTNQQQSVAEEVDILMDAGYEFKTMKDTGEIYYYDQSRGIYVEGGEIIIQTQAESMNRDTTTHRVNEIMNHIRRQTHIDRSEFDSDPDIINIKNGLLNIHTKELKPHTPEYLSLIQLSNLVYNPEVKCPVKIAKFLTEVFSSGDCTPVQSESIADIVKLFGYILLRDISKYEKSFMFVGNGSNGKSVMIKLIEAFVGSKSCSHVSLQNLNSDRHRFMISELYGKMVNTHADIPSDAIENSGMFKAIVSGDTVFGEKKHKPPFPFRNRAKLIFSANKIPETPDQTYAFYRRWVILTFNRYFAGEDRNEDLIHELTTEDELSGLLNIALVGLKWLIRDHGFNDKSVGAVRDQYEHDTTLVKQFLNEKCDIQLNDLSYFTLKPTLIHEFFQYCKSRDIAPLDINDFEKELISMGIVPGRSTVNKVKGSVYRGVITAEDFNKRSREDLLSKRKRDQQQQQQQTIY